MNSPDPYEQPIGKPWRRSRTIWFNIATLLVAVATEFSALVELLPPDHQPTVRFFLMLLLAVGNVIFRILTSEPLK